MRSKIFDLSKLPESPIKVEEITKGKHRRNMLSPAELREIKAKKLKAKQERDQ
jgi:hypothetical protein